MDKRYTGKCLYGIELIDILITLNSTKLGKNIKWHVLIIHEAPGDEVQLPPVVGLTARHHELPVRNLSATEIQN